MRFAARTCLGHIVLKYLGEYKSLDKPHTQNGAPRFDTKPALCLWKMNMNPLDPCLEISFFTKPQWLPPVDLFPTGWILSMAPKEAGAPLVGAVQV